MAKAKGGLVFRLKAVIDRTSSTFTLPVIQGLFFTVLRSPPEGFQGIPRPEGLCIFHVLGLQMLEPPELASFIRLWFSPRSIQTSERLTLSSEGVEAQISFMHVRVYLVSHPLEQLDEHPGVALHHVRLQVRQRHQLEEQLDEENVVVLAEPLAVQLQKPEGWVGRWLRG